MTARASGNHGRAVRRLRSPSSPRPGMPSTRRSSKHRDTRFSSSPRSFCASGGIFLPIQSIPHRYRSQLRGASTVRLISHLPAANTYFVPNEIDHHGKRSCVLFAACTRSQDRFGHSSRFVFGSCYGGIVALFPAINVGYFGGRNASGIIGVMYTSPPPTPACRPALSARTFSGRTISGIARAACGLASAARRTERQVNADRHMRTSSRLDPARRARSTHHARASSARMSRRCDGRLPCSKRAVSILQLWCNLNPCTSIRGLH